MKATDERLFNLIKSNIQVIGNKQFANVDISLLKADERYQRVNTTRAAKITKLVKAFDFNKMDALKVSVHNDEKKFFIIDGYHRYMAAKELGLSALPCEILKLPDSGVERLKAEARLFAEQDMAVDKLMPIQTHDANLILGIRENVIVQNLIEKHGIQLKKSIKGQVGTVNTLSGFYTALRVARGANGEEILDKVFSIIIASGWNLTKTGMQKWVIHCLATILKLHNDDMDAVASKLSSSLRGIEPSGLLAVAKAKYPNRTTNQSVILLLEDTIK